MHMDGADVLGVGDLGPKMIFIETKYTGLIELTAQ